MRNNLTVIILLLTLLTLGCFRPTEESLRQPPCDLKALGSACQTYNDVQKVSLCELSREPGLYDGHVVRVEAIVIIDASDVNLFDQACSDGGIHHPGVTFEQGYGIRAEAQEGVRKLFCQGDEYYMSKRVAMTFVGRFNVEAANDRRRLTMRILCVEQVNPARA